MIEGLKVTVEATELRALCIARGQYHMDRSAVYENQLKNMEQAEIEGMNYSNGDPKKVMREKIDDHIAQANELEFIADHLKEGEEYLLERDDLVKLGISQPSGFWR